MAPTKQLLTLTQLRQQRGAMTERDLMHRCRDAARLELRGSMFSPDDRLDVASRIMLDGLEQSNGSLPSADDPRHSLGAYCKRAQTLRRSIDRERARDDLAAQLEEDRAAWGADALMPEYVPEPEISTPASAASAADLVCWRLSRAPHSCVDAAADYRNVWSLLYGYARDLPGPVVAHEIDLSPNAYGVRCNRARSAIRKRYPTPTDWLRALIGEPVPVIDPMTGEQVFRFVVTDASKEAHDRTHALAVDWRTGTDGGAWPTRPDTADAAREVCAVTQGRPAPKSSAKRAAKAARKVGGAEQATADALRRLSYALSRS